MTATAPVDVVFGADLTSVPDLGANGSIAFGEQTFGGTSTVGIEFSTDGSSYASFGSVDLTAVDTLFTVNPGLSASDLAPVRLSFAEPGAGGQAIIDHVTRRTELRAGGRAAPARCPIGRAAPVRNAGGWPAIGASGASSRSPAPLRSLRPPWRSPRCANARTRG